MYSLNIESNALHLVMAFNEGGRELAAKALEIVRHAYGVKRVVVHVVSGKEPPFYIAEIRELLTGNISRTLICRYHGSTPDDLKAVLRTLKGSRLMVLIDPRSIGYVKAASEAQVQTLSAGGV